MSHKYKIKSVLRSLGVVLTTLANHDVNKLVRSVRYQTWFTGTVMFLLVTGSGEVLLCDPICLEKLDLLSPLWALILKILYP